MRFKVAFLLRRLHIVLSAGIGLKGGEELVGEASHLLFCSPFQRVVDRDLAGGGSAFNGLPII